MTTGVLIQQASGRYVPMLELTARHHRGYCAQHGISYWALAGEVQSSRAAHWNKIALIRRALDDGFDTVAWLDADTLIVDRARDIRTALNGEGPLGMAIHASPGFTADYHYNSGVMIMRNTPGVQAFFEAVWREGPVAGTHWQEQARILELIRRTPGIVQALDSHWNATAGLAPVSNPIIKAWHGAGPTAVMRMHQELERLCAEGKADALEPDALVHDGNAAQRAREFIESIPASAPEYRGRGIVIPAGGLGYFTCAWIAIHQLRRLGCALPIQLWHLGDRELDARMRALVAPLGVECVNAHDTGFLWRADWMAAWELKSHALLHSPYREVLLLDSDNVPAVDPAFLFESREFADTGAVFWPDQERMPPGHRAWRLFDVPFRDEPEMESGQVLVDKVRCWRAVSLANWYNEHSTCFYGCVRGDKDTFRFAWHRLGQRFLMPPFPVRALGPFLLQHDFTGRVVFQHRYRDKWNYYRDNTAIPGFRFEAECLEDLRRLRSLWDGRIGVLR